MTLFHERFKAEKLITPVQRLQKQQQGLEKIGHCMSVLQNVVSSSFAACKLLKTDFIASNNDEVKKLVAQCYTIAKNHGVDFHLNVSDYNYFNPEKHSTMPFGIPADLQRDEWNAQEYNNLLDIDEEYGHLVGEDREWLSSSC